MKEDIIYKRMAIFVSSFVAFVIKMYAVHLFFCSFFLLGDYISVHQKFNPSSYQLEYTIFKLWKFQNEKYLEFCSFKILLLFFACDFVFLTREVTSYEFNDLYTKHDKLILIGDVK